MHDILTPLSEHPVATIIVGWLATNVLFVLLAIAHGKNRAGAYRHEWLNAEDRVDDLERAERGQEARARAAESGLREYQRAVRTLTTQAPTTIVIDPWRAAARAGEPIPYDPINEERATDRHRESVMESVERIHMNGRAVHH